MNVASLEVAHVPVVQQPRWQDQVLLRRARGELASLPPLVDTESLSRLRVALAGVAAGRAHVVQVGDCAEDFAESSPVDVARKVALLDLLAGIVTAGTHRPVVRVGRIAGQYAKPRSAPTEWVEGVELPVYRGHLVNGPEPDPQARQADPMRLLAGYRAARQVMSHLGSTPRARVSPRVWTSHEALLLDYEVPMLRRDRVGRPALTSTHWPWIGERTRQLDGAHVALLSGVVNPVACKVGPSMTAEDLLGLCERLDPGRTPGRLTLISRMGAQECGQLLPPLVAAVRAAGHPVIWLVDPMHGNTVITAQGRKTRVLATLVREVEAFHQAVRSAGGTAGGIHLETTPDDVTECVDEHLGPERVGEKYTSLCDPRLNPRQAVTVVSAFAASTAVPATSTTQAPGLPEQAAETPRETPCQV